MNRESFKHLVGKSTLSQGVTVRRDFEDWFNAPKRGQAREILLLFGPNEVKTTLRRLNNDNGNVQIRYQGNQHRALREWLQSESVNNETQLLEFLRVGDDIYQLQFVKEQAFTNLHLCLGPGLYHNNAALLAASSETYSDIGDAIGLIKFIENKGQSHYNEQIRQHFLARGWQSDEPAIPDLPLRFDFRKEDVQVEVEFGNARSYYQDYLKFLLPFTRGMIRIGVLLVPTSDFTRLLCAAGTRRALARANRDGLESYLPKYSGMISYEKVEREFDSLRFILNMPLIIRGIDFWG